MGFTFLPPVPVPDALVPSSAWQPPDVDMDLDDDEAGEELGAAGFSKLASPGDVITSATAFMRGHGTYVEDGKVISSISGVVERVNKLVSVRALRARYNPEVGDLVVGRIIDVGPKRWRVDAYSRQDAVLMLSSINLPGGVQRRKLESDELQMRNFFSEGDLLVAEVQAFFADGAISLHTRSLKYGKLRNGLLVTVSPVLIRRLKSHFITLPCGVDVILGMNGYIWISKHVASISASVRGGADEGFEAEAVYSSQNEEIDHRTRQSITRVRNVIETLARHNVPLTDTVLAEAYDLVVELEEQASSGDELSGPGVLLSSDEIASQLVAGVVGSVAA